jgi:hypothetical protein
MYQALFKRLMVLTLSRYHIGSKEYTVDPYTNQNSSDLVDSFFSKDHVNQGLSRMRDRYRAIVADDVREATYLEHSCTRRKNGIRAQEHNTR